MLSISEEREKKCNAIVMKHKKNTTRKFPKLVLYGNLDESREFVIKTHCMPELMPELMFIHSHFACEEHV